MNINGILYLKQYESLSRKLKSFKVFTKDFVWACYSMQTTKSVCFSWHIISWFDMWFRIYKTFKNVFLTKYGKWYICHRLWKSWYIYVHFCLYWNKRAITVWNISLLYNLLYHYSNHIDQTIIQHKILEISIENDVTVINYVIILQDIRCISNEYASKTNVTYRRPIIHLCTWPWLLIRKSIL